MPERVRPLSSRLSPGPMRPLAAWASICAAAVGCAQSHTRLGSRDAAGVGDGGAVAAPTSVPFLHLDAAVPSCPLGPPSATHMDAGPIPERDCGASPSVSFANDIKPLLAANCTGEICHEGSWAGSPNEYEDLVGAPTPECCDGRKRVDPVHPDRSYLLEKLRGTDLCAGRPMPLSGHVSPAQVAQIARWICEGAPRN